MFLQSSSFLPQLQTVSLLSFYDGHFSESYSVNYVYVETAVTVVNLISIHLYICMMIKW